MYVQRDRDTIDTNYTINAHRNMYSVSGEKTRPSVEFTEKKRIHKKKRTKKNRNNGTRLARRRESIGVRGCRRNFPFIYNIYMGPSFYIPGPFSSFTACFVRFWSVDSFSFFPFILCHFLPAQWYRIFPGRLQFAEFSVTDIVLTNWNNLDDLKIWERFRRGASKVYLQLLFSVFLFRGGESIEQE